MSQRVQVPAQQAVAIHYPGYVQDADAALDTMGGIRRISDAHFAGSANFVQVKCRPGDELAHPIFGERQPCNALLLRLTQPNARDSSVGAGSGSEQSTVKAEIVARVATGYRFTGMADFQYTDALSADLGEFAEVDGPFGPERSPMTVLPPLFSKQDEPLDYSFKRQPPLPAPSQPRKQAQQPAALQPPKQPTAALPQKPQQHAQQPAAQPTLPQQPPQQHGSLLQHQKAGPLEPS